MINWIQKKNWLKKTAIGLSLAALIGAGYYEWKIEPYLPTPTQLQTIKPKLVTRIYTPENELVKEFCVENREPVKIDKIPKHVTDALLSKEDRQFYSHNGINFRGAASSLWQFAKTLKRPRGGSGITQQLARDLFLTKERSLTRKAREALTALKIEGKYSKQQILEFYLNQVYFGAGNYGIEAASRNYFDKTTQQLTIPEAALLIGLIQSPEKYRPDKHLDMALKRRDLVLRMMLDNKKITKDQYDNFVKEQMTINGKKSDNGIGPYFTEDVRQDLEEKIGAKELYTGGYDVQITMNKDVQKTADSIVTSILAERQKPMDRTLAKNLKLDKWAKIPLDKVITNMDSIYHEYKKQNPKCKQRKILQAALVAISNFDGSILAMVGGNNFKYEKFNRATQSLRSPGSTFKAFVYTTALDNGYDLESRLLDIPVVYEYATKEGTKVWIPENYEEDYVGETTLKYACAHSRNVATIDLLNKIGIEKAVKYARAFGLKGRIPQVPAIAIGGGCETTVLEMAASYSVFPNQGYLKKPHYLEKIINRQTKEIIYQNNYEETKAIDELTANKMTELLESVVKEGTGKSIINIYQFNQPCAGKTGTTNNSADTWFIGYTPYITTAVWVGYDNNSSVGNKETGATSALPIWAQFMKKTHENLPYRDFDFRTNNDGLIKDANYSNQNEGLENNNAMENSENKDNPENNIDDTAAQNNYDNANSE